MLRAHTAHMLSNPYQGRHGSWTSSDPFLPYERAYGRPGLNGPETLARHLEAADVSSSLPHAPIEFGAVGVEVQAVQIALQKLGYFGTGALDLDDEKDIFGDKTVASIVAYVFHTFRRDYLVADTLRNKFFLPGISWTTT